MVNIKTLLTTVYSPILLKTKKNIYIKSRYIKKFILPFYFTSCKYSSIAHSVILYFYLSY